MFPEALSFKDVLLVPQRSGIRTRRDADVSGRFSTGIALKTPLVSANMDTVTESATAIAMARLGGLGIVHRFLTIGEEVGEVLKVKRAENIVIDSPYVVRRSDTVAEARRVMRECEVGGLLVVDGAGRLEGVVTDRDVRFVEDGTLPVRRVMSTQLVTARPGVPLEAARRLLGRHKIEKLPLVDKGGKLKGLITAKDILKRQRFPDASKDRRGHLLVGAAVGVIGDYLERARALQDAGADVLVMDVAHGHAEHAIAALRRIKKACPSAEVVPGNVATYAGARDLVRAGADGVKVGVGPGATCSTRVVSGHGVPQLSAVLDCARLTRTTGVPICADGGIRDSGDLAKALAAGASCAMIGSLFAGTDESPGWTIVREGMRYKVYRGMASLGATLGRRQKEGARLPDNDEVSEVVPEGVESMVPYRGRIAEVVHQLVGGLRSGLSYSGARDLKSFQRKAKFVRITAAGWAESIPRKGVIS